jgi:hypothetical protein
VESIYTAATSGARRGGQRKNTDGKQKQQAQEMQTKSKVQVEERSKDIERFKYAKWEKSTGGWRDRQDRTR